MLSPEIQTERLILKQTSKLDDEHFFALLQNPQVVKFCFDAPPPEEIQIQFESRLMPWNITSSHWLSLSIYEKTRGFLLELLG